jgi:putative ABC transport system permease protein
MLKTYFLLAFRNLMKNKFFVLVNVLGLGTTLACCIVSYFNYRYEFDYNRHFDNLDRIYKVNIFRFVNETEQRYGITPTSLAPAIGDRIAGVENVVRFINANYSLSHKVEEEQKIFSQRVGFADDDFFKVFSHPILWGTTSTFSDKSSIILTKETSERFFGEANPVGKSITLYSEKGEPYELTITAVLKKIPENTVITFQAITNFSNFLTLRTVDELNWKTWVGATFLKIPNKIDVPRVQEQLAEFIDIQNMAREDFQIIKYEVMSLKDFTKITHDIWANWLGFNMHPAQIFGPLIMGILILLLATFNYMNTSISIANTRLKEIGVRKVMGSSRRQLIAQFLGENAGVCFLALLTSIIISIFLMNEYNKMWNYMELEMSFAGNFGFWAFLFVLLVFTSLLGGAYSAFYISSFKAVDVFRGSYRLKEGGWLSRILLWFQITVSIMALIVSIVFTQNARYQETVEKGYDIDNLIVVELPSGVDSRAIKAAYESNPEIESVAYTSNHVGWGGYTRIIGFQDKKVEADIYEVGTDYFKSMGLQLIEGRGFEAEFESSDVNKTVVLDQSSVELLGLTDPVGQIIRLDTFNLRVLGVVNNFHAGFWSKPTPRVFWTRTTEPLRLVVIRTKERTSKRVMEFLKDEWEKMVTFVPFWGREQKLFDEDAYNINKGIKNINVFLAFIAIVLSSVALYTLVSLSILKRIKEIGVRTVLGSSQAGVNWLISRPFMAIVALASISGGFGGYFLTELLLDSLWPDRVAINTTSIALPIITMLILAYLIISIRVYITMSKNPVESLRYE